jgi:hypothetical protein
MKRFMDEVDIPDGLQTGVIKELMDMMAEQSLKIQQKRDGFVVVDTRGTLLDRKDWVNEIHPGRDGFEAIAGRIYGEIERVFPVLVRDD